MNPNGNQPSHVIAEWHHPVANRCFVLAFRCDSMGKPESGSPAAAMLGELAADGLRPQRGMLTFAAARFGRLAAKALVTMRAKQLAEAGYQVLDTSAPKPLKPLVEWEGGLYRSVCECSRITGIPRMTLRRRLGLCRW